MNLIIRGYILFCWTVSICVLLFSPMTKSDDVGVTYGDKIVHIFLFGVFMFLLFWFFSLFKKVQIRYVVWVSFLISISFSYLGEHLQAFIPGRTVSSLDFYAGSFGIIISLCIIYFFYGKRRTKKA